MGVNGYLRKEGRQRFSGGEFELADLLVGKTVQSAWEKVNQKAALGSCSVLKNLRRQIVRCCVGSGVIRTVTSELW